MGHLAAEEVMFSGSFILSGQSRFPEVGFASKALRGAALAVRKEFVWKKEELLLGIQVSQVNAQANIRFKGFVFLFR
jgi:hypothetical protein